MGWAIVSAKADRRRDRAPASAQQAAPADESAASETDMAIDADRTGGLHRSADARAAERKARLRRLGNKRVRRRLFARVAARIGGFLGPYVFSSLTRRIVFLNLAGLCALV